ncbi:MAG TPA: hypothetical protein VHO69_04560 [Phototrophicaceae bacterium]|nr:hypothetical protein [Phototrophicaceae bacterium]
MNDDTLAMMVAVCGLASVVVLLAGILVLRVLRFSVFGFANMIMRMLTEPKDAPDVANVQAQTVPHTSLDSLRAKADQVASFDAAVAQQRQEQQLDDSGNTLLEPKPFVPDPPDPKNNSPFKN